VSDAIAKTHRAITQLRVEGDEKIEARIDWASGYPKIIIRWKGD
jgi:hypothetical protein